MAETIEADDESWTEVIVTLAISTTTSLLFLTTYEIARRKPTLIEVFDRRRATKPNRTPPPLLRNSIFEWLFLSNDPSYAEYSDLSHMRDVIMEKRKQRNPDRKGFWRSWTNSSSTGGVISPRSDVNVGEGFKGGGSSSGGDEESAIRNNPIKDTIEVRTNSFDINNSRNDANGNSSRRSKYSSSTTNSLKDNAKKIIIRRHLTPDVVEVNGWRLPKAVEEYALANDLTEDQLYDYEHRLLEQERKDEIEFQKRRRNIANDWNGSGCVGNRAFMGDLNLQMDDTTLEQLESDVHLTLPPRKSRLWYFGFQHNKIDIPKTDQKCRTDSSPTLQNSNKRPESGSSVTRRLGRTIANIRYVMSSRNQLNPNRAYDQQTDEDIHLRRHLKAVSVLEKRPLSASDVELLRCIGLDTFVMIRFLRFCFDVTFYPFIAACIILLPSYAYNNFEGDIESDEGTVKTQTDGYFLLTINRLEPSSSRLWISFGFALLHLIFILRRLWIEWETFLPLRFDFLANGDVDSQNSKKKKNYKSRAVVAPKDDVQLHLEQYRNSCIVEYIPDSHRRDQELHQFFDAVFPGQVKRAEILLSASELTNLIKKRQTIIEKYERTYAKYTYKQKKYIMKEGTYSGDKGFCAIFQKAPRKPTVPMIMLGRRPNRKAVQALPHYRNELNNLNRQIEKVYKEVSKEKKIAMDFDQRNDLVRNTYAEAKKFVTGEAEDLKCDTGFVEFMNLTAKQSALQCNITGTNGFMVLTSAPDPRDIVWDNATVEKRIIIVKNAQCGLLLFTGTLFWFAVVGFVTSLSNIDQYREKDILPEWMFPEKDSILYDLIEGFVPVVLLELLMLIVPFTLRIVAKKIIRFKTHSEIDQFIYRWHFAYRITNLISIIVRQQILKTLDLFLKSPKSTVDYLAGSIALSSQFFLNNMLVAAGTETFFELSQLFNIVKHVVVNKFITLEATSQRDLERMQEPVSLEWGEKIPPFIFALLVASIYSTVVPVVMGACALYFYVAAKVYTHQALFIYAQPYEGGGKLMYLLNRSVFGIIYITICFFTAILGLKKAGFETAVFFLTLMLIITFVIDRWITTKFVNPSTTLALTNARLIDEETKARNERRRLYKEFKDDLRRQKEEEERERKREKYLPSSLMAQDSESFKLKQRVQFENGENKRHAGRSANKSSSESRDREQRRRQERQNEFYLYRQPQLNKALWETQPRIGN